MLFSNLGLDANCFSRIVGSKAKCWDGMCDTKLDPTATSRLHSFNATFRRFNAAQQYALLLYYHCVKHFLESKFCSFIAGLAPLPGSSSRSRRNEAVVKSRHNCCQHFPWVPSNSTIHSIQSTEWVSMSSKGGFFSAATHVAKVRTCQVLELNLQSTLRKAGK